MLSDRKDYRLVKSAVSLVVQADQISAFFVVVENPESLTEEVSQKVPEVEDHESKSYSPTNSRISLVNDETIKIEFSDEESIAGFRG